MKIGKFTLPLIFLVLFLAGFNANSQTPGTMTFTFTNPVPGNNASKNVFAVWIEDSTGKFIKTRCRYWSTKTNDHLPSWKTKSSQNTVDAITGATLTSATNPSAFGSKTFTWNGTDVNGNIVADGTYKVLVESSWCNPEPANNQHKFISSFTFEKSSTQTSTSPTDVNLNNISISWQPTSSGVNEIENEQDFNLYPNPTNGTININFEYEMKIREINVTSLDGKIIQSETFTNQSFKSSQLDLNNLKEGMYYLEVILQDGKALTKSFVIRK